MKAIAEFIRDQSGATAMEYAFVLGIISLASIAAFGSIANSINSTFSGLASGLDAAGS